MPLVAWVYPRVVGGFETFLVITISISVGERVAITIGLGVVVETVEMVIGP